MRVLVLLAFLLATFLTYREAMHPTTPASHTSVLLTTSYAIGAGTLTNILCATGAYLTSGVPRGMECDACLPWSVVVTAVTARLHVFKEGGWGAEERAYAKGLGRAGVRWAVGGPRRWLETFEGYEADELAGRRETVTEENTGLPREGKSTDGGLEG